MRKLWESFFENITTDNELDKFLRSISGKVIQDWEHDYQEYNDNSKQIIKRYFEESVFTENLELEGLKQDINWISLYAPICEKYVEEIKANINGFDFIKDKDGFLRNFRFVLYSMCVNKSYRTVLKELCILKENDELKGDDETKRYWDFVDRISTSKQFIEHLYMKYPVLFDLINLYSKQSAEYTLEILEHINNDKEQLIGKFDLKEFVLEAIKYGMGDTHLGGRTVCELYLQNGKVLIYKPRSSEIDNRLKIFSEVVYKKTGIQDVLNLPDNLSFPEYSYIEYIERKECSNDEDVKRYYRNIGKTLCILYIFNAKDYHGENIMASGDKPYLIDNETIFHKANDSGRCGVEEISGKIIDSVYGSGLLPITISSEKPEDLWRWEHLTLGRYACLRFRRRS